jgi:pimeloyl-[acyl-carrier protein] methyl ester esterase
VQRSSNGRFNVVLLHGWGFDHRVWDGFADALPDYWHVEQPDLFDHETCSSDLTDKELGLIILPLQEYLIRPCVLVGWSFGGLVAISLARQFPEKVSAVVLLASSPCFTSRPDWHCGIDDEQISDLAERVENDRKGALKYFCRLVAHGDTASFKVARILQTHTSKINKAGLLYGLNILANTDLRSDLAALTCPLATILSSNDVLIQSAVAREISKLKADTHHALIENAGHAPFILKKSETALRLEEFLNDCCS